MNPNAKKYGFKDVILIVGPMSKYAKIKCSQQNHMNMNYEFICLNANCRSHNKWLGCLQCCEEFHRNHKDDLVTIKEVIMQLEENWEKTEYNMLAILLEGMKTCCSYEDLKTNVAELLAYRNKSDRFEKILDEEMEVIQGNTQRHYQRIHERNTARSISQKSTTMYKPFVTPVLTFKQNHQYTFNSPFSITSTQNELVTAFAYPSLSKFHDSIDVKIKIDRYTPSWLAVGLSIGQSRYEEGSQKHMLAISNGWISNRGVLQKSKVHFGGGDQLTLKWNKNMELVELISRKSKETIRFENKWNEEVYLCVCLFYKGDKVSILS